MSVIIKPMESPSEIEGKAYVHWKSWQEAYKGLIDLAYLDSLTLDKCVKIAYQCESRVENKRSKSSGDAAKDMKKQAR